MLTAGTPAPPTGALVVSLNWDTEADLDLHVVIPNVADPDDADRALDQAPIGCRRSPSAQPLDPTRLATAPYLDFDSNANCVIDGLRQENVIFPTGGAPPPGDYTVRVDTSSLCGQADAQWVGDRHAHDPTEQDRHRLARSGRRRTPTRAAATAPARAGWPSRLRFLSP